MIDAKDCGDFENWFYAQGWDKFYDPTYGDIAGLDDGERDGLVCQDGVRPALRDSAARCHSVVVRSLVRVDVSRS